MWNLRLGCDSHDRGFPNDFVNKNMVETVVQHGCGGFIDLQDWVVVLGRKLSVLAINILQNTWCYAGSKNPEGCLGGQSITQSETNWISWMTTLIVELVSPKIRWKSQNPEMDPKILTLVCRKDIVNSWDFWAPKIPIPWDWYAYLPTWANLH